MCLRWFESARIVFFDSIEWRSAVQVGAVAAEGEAVIVMVNYEEGGKVPLSDTIREHIYRVERGA